MARARFRSRFIGAIADFLGWDPDETDLSDLSQRLYEGVVATGVELAGSGPRYLHSQVTVDIHPADLHALTPLEGPLVDSLNERLRRESHRRNLKMAGALRFEFIADEFVRRGRPRVRAGAEAPAEPMFFVPPVVDTDDVPTDTLTETMGGGVGAARLLPVKGAGSAITRSGSVGRGARADIRLDSARVSNLHARVHFVGSKCTVRDLDSTNGTFVNGDRLASGTVVTLVDDDAVRFADVEYVVVGAGGLA